MTKDVNADPRKIKAAAMLASGLPPAKVAEALNVSLRTIHRWQQEPGFAELKSDVTAKVADETIKNTVQNLNQEIKPLFTYQARKALILKECSHLDEALNAILPKVRKGDLMAIAALVKISERRCRMLGLDQPKNNITDAISVLTQNGILPESRASSAFEILDEAQSKLFQIGADPDL